MAFDTIMCPSIENSKIGREIANTRNVLSLNLEAEQLVRFRMRYSLNLYT